MKRIVRLFIFCSTFFVIYNKADSAILPIDGSAVIYILNGGRFGDNLMSYAKAKWISYSYGIPLIYTPFKYSDQLMMHENEYKRTSDVTNMFACAQHLYDKYQIEKNENIIYVSNWNTKVAINWKDKKFLQELKKQIAPRYKLDTINIPTDCISIAIHIRTGGGFSIDTDSIKRRYPLRFVPIEFYINQIKRLAHMFEDEKLYIHIFTDHQQPKKLIKIIKSYIDNENIFYGYRENDNHHNVNILEDFFSMTQFDCLIRPGSHFSRFVQRVGDHKIVIYPVSARFINKNKWIITKVSIWERTKNGWKTWKEIIE